MVKNFKVMVHHFSKLKSNFYYSVLYKLDLLRMKVRKVDFDDSSPGPAPQNIIIFRQISNSKAKFFSPVQMVAALHIRDNYLKLLNIWNLY